MWDPRRWLLKSGKRSRGAGVHACAGRPRSANSGSGDPLQDWSPAPLIILVSLMVSGAWLLRGELEPWVQHTPAGPIIAALFRSVGMPGGSMPIRRPPAETRPALTHLISGAPRDAMLYRFRAQEAEVALDFTAAEADWKTYAQTAADPYAAQIELADFYHRRIRP